MKNILLLISIALGALTFSPAMAQAETPSACTIIYGGGAIDCKTMKQAITQAQPTSAPQQAPANTAPVQQQPATTKGGLPIHKPTQTNTTPATGPEAWSLLSLLPMAGAGIWLKKRS
jgi:hypothetical protein